MLSGDTERRIPNNVIAYWFSREDGCTDNLKDPAVVGKTDNFNGEIVPCKAGLHSSPSPWAALAYATGPILWVVDTPNNAVAHGNPVDKYVASSRSYLFSIDCTALMRQFAAQCALGVFDKWAPPLVVREYIEGTARGEDKSDIRASAVASAVADCDAWAASWDAVEVSCDADEAAVWGAARAASRGAWAAARAAVADAWETPRAAAWDASWANAWAAWNISMAKAWATQAASWAAQQDNFRQLVVESLEAAGWEEDQHDSRKD